MTALSASARRSRRGVDGERIHSLVVGTGATIYAGGLVNYNVSTGRIVAATAAASRKFAGLALETKTGNTSGTVSCKIVSNCELLIGKAAALTDAYLGANAAVSDDNTVTTASDAGTAGVQVLVGRIVEISGSNAWVALNEFAEAAV